MKIKICCYDLFGLYSYENENSYELNFMQFACS